LLEEKLVSKISIGVELDKDLATWFEEYCEDGLLSIDEELSAILEGHIESQLEEVGEVDGPLMLDEEEILEDLDGLEEELFEE
tara:strand:- start:325 stop:573 length:249 start_codon:yes stop_codon:yes gene_type:complete